MSTNHKHIFKTDCPFDDYFNDCPCYYRCLWGRWRDKLDRLADALKRLTGKVIEALPAIVRSVVGAILSFLVKTVGFVAEHAWVLIVFVVGLIGVWLIQKVKKD